MKIIETTAPKEFSKVFFLRTQQFKWFILGGYLLSLIFLAFTYLPLDTVNNVLYNAQYIGFSFQILSGILVGVILTMLIHCKRSSQNAMTNSITRGIDYGVNLLHVTIIMIVLLMINNVFPMIVRLFVMASDSIALVAIPRGEIGFKLLTEFLLMFSCMFGAYAIMEASRKKIITAVGTICFMAVLIFTFLCIATLSVQYVEYIDTDKSLKLIITSTIAMCVLFTNIVVRFITVRGDMKR